MAEFTRKNPVDIDILRKQILEEARQYTDAAIDAAIDSIIDNDQLDVSETDPISIDIGVGDLIPAYPIPEEKPPAVIEKVEFLNDSNVFTYDDNFSYGNLYVSSDGQYAVDVTAKAYSADPEISNIEIQITRIDNEG